MSEAGFEDFVQDHLTNKSVSPETGYTQNHVTDYQISLWNSKLNDVSNPIPGQRYVAYSS
jgi:hypothetical protein